MKASSQDALIAAMDPMGGSATYRTGHAQSDRPWGHGSPGPGTRSGADDYLVKPFAFRELEARVRALLRHDASERSQVLRFLDLTLDTRTHEGMRLWRSMPLSIRLQLAVWYTSAFAILLLLTGAVFYQYLKHALEAILDTELLLRFQQIGSSLVIRQGTITPQALAAVLPGWSGSYQGSDSSLADVNQGVLIRILDAQGRLLGGTPACRVLHIPDASIRSPLQGIPWQGTVLSTQHEEVRLNSRIVRSAGKPVAAIQVGESLAMLHTLLHQLVAALLVVGSLVLVACAEGTGLEMYT